MEQNKTWADVDLSALRHNYRLLQKTVAQQNPSARMIAVVKADAYGHGSPECVCSLLDEGCDFFAVSCIDEALAVRRACDTHKKKADVLILGYTDPSFAKYLAACDFIQALLSEEYTARLEAEAAKAKVTVRAHVAIDTGMNRVGYPAHAPEEIEVSAASIKAAFSLPHLRIEGMFTHFARADEDPNGQGGIRTELQCSRYRALRARLEDGGVFIPFHHVCNSAATVLRPNDCFDGVRVGILLFGASPSPLISLPLRSVLCLRTVIVHTHTLLPGEEVSYGGRYKTDTERTVATIPIGYADGFLRAYRGCIATVETENGPRPAPIVGSICMDQCMLDVTDTGARPGDTVTLFGRHPSELEALAKAADTIPYECLCLLSPRVKRHYVDGDGAVAH